MSDLLAGAAICVASLTVLGFFYWAEPDAAGYTDCTSSYLDIRIQEHGT